MPITKLLGITSSVGITNPYQATVNPNFAKNSFNIGTANPNRPDTRVYDNALGDPVKGVELYCLG